MGNNFFGITDTGKMRSNNEDTFIVETVLDGKYIAACVIDGVGGYSGGEVAAKLAHDAILNNLRNTSADLIKQMRDALAAANESIYREKHQSKGNEQMACVLTLALADIASNKFYYAHVGDTRLYLFRDSSLVKVTRDHSFVGFLEDSGRLTEEAAMKHPKRNEINKALGFDAQIGTQADYIETGDSPFLPGDTLLLCSDGLSDMISNSVITNILKSDKTLPQKGKALIQAANDAGGKDNITVVIVQNDKSPLKQEARKPVLVKKNETNAPVELAEVKKEDKTEVVVSEKNKKKKSSAVSILSILCILLLAAFLWMVYKNWNDSKTASQQMATAPTVEKKRNEQEQRLLDSINAAPNNEVFIVNTGDGKPIVISDSILVQKDTLHIIGNGVTLLRDSSYTGSALTLAANCKYILLDSLTIENFDIGILAKSNALRFKNVQFKNCRVPVQYQVSFADNQVLNGKFADTIFYNKDTTTKK